MGLKHEDIINWINKKFPEPEKPKVQCPKVHMCVMDCYHRVPHVYEEKYCNNLDGACGIVCVHELLHDCTFFDEDFNV